MAGPGTKADFVINDAIASFAYIEKLGQMTNAFNAASNGAILLTTESVIGDFEKEDFFKEMAESQMAKERDPVSLSAITPEKLTEISNINVKLNRYSFISNTLDSFKKKGWTADTFSMLAGEAAAMASVSDKLNTLIACGVGAIQSEPTMVIGDGTKDIAYTDFPLLLGTFGDALDSIGLLVMHSSSYYNLMGTAVSEKLVNVAGFTINDGANPTFGIPVLVTDSPELSMTAGKAIIGLTKGGLVAVDSEALTIDAGTLRGKENILLEIQTEYAYNVRVKGYSYTKGTVSPTRTLLKAKASWGKSATDVKNTAGAIFNTKS